MGRYAAVIAILVVMGTSPLHAQEAVYVVTMTSAEVHKAPSTGSPVIARATRGRTFEIRRELGSWVSVDWPGADAGVAYLHLAWGRVARGGAAAIALATAAETPRATPSLSATGPASGSASGLTAPSAFSPAPQALDSDLVTPQVQVPQAPRTSTVPRRAPSLPSHVIGLGGRIGSREVGMAITGRAWAFGPLGLQLEAGQSTYTSIVSPGQLQSMQLAPSVIYAPPSFVTNAIWARPYVGAGMDLYRSRLRNPFDGTDTVDRVLGSHILGGAEFTWANAPQLTLSADVRQQWTPATFTDFELDGLGASVSLHWYVK